MATILSNNIDFSSYMKETDTAHSVRKPSSYVEDVITHFHGNEQAKGAKLPWRKTWGDIRLREGEVSLWNGWNGAGKSLVLGQVCLALAEQNEGVCIASMEMKPHVTLARMCRQAYGKELPDIDFIRYFHSITDGKLWLYDQQGTVRTDKMLAVIRYCADKIKAKHIVIDSLMKCGMGEDDYNAQKAFVDQITSAARDNGTHVHVVAHSRKGSDELKPPGKMDVKGSSAITDQVDNVFTIWRNKGKERAIQESLAYSVQDPDALLICDKQRNGEWEGKVALWFDRPSHQFIGGVAEATKRFAL